MALTNSQPNNINVPNGNGLVVYIDGETNEVYVRDVRGATEELNVLTNSLTNIIAEGGLTALKVGSVVTMGTDSSIIQLKIEKGQPNGYASLDANGKLPVSQLPVSVLTYEGMWNAATNTPTLADGTGNAGDFYIVSVAGTQNLGSGPISFEVGDWVIYNGSIWQRNSSNLPDLQEVTDVGATTTNAINTAGITTDYVQLDLTATPTLTVGMARWNTSQLTWEVGLGTGPIAYEMGQSLFYPQVRNTSGTNLPKGTLVMVDPTDVSTGDRLNVVRAVANGTYISQLIVGVLAQAISSGQTGTAVWFGQIYNVANSAINLGGQTWADGDILYADPANPGGFTKVEPSAPNLKVTVAAIQGINGNNVNLLVRPWLNEKIGQLSDVAITSPVDNSILQFNSTTGVWEDVAGTTTNIAEGTNLYFTTERARQSVSASTGLSYVTETGVFTNTDRGSSQDIYKQIAVATQTTLTANSNNTVLTVIAGTNVSLTTNSVNNSLTINAVGETTGSGTTNYVSKWTGTTALGDSLIFDNGQNVGINTALPFNLGANTNSLTIQGTNGAAIELQTNGVGGLRLASSATGSLAGEVRNFNFDLYANAQAKLGVLATGTIRLYDYGTGSKTGTAAYNLLVDASGNIIEGAGGVIDGSGTTNYVSKFTDSNTIGNSIIYDSGSAVGIGTPTPSTKLQVDGTVTATTFSGDLNGTINTATTGFTQANSDNSTKVATTAFVQNLLATVPAGLSFQGTWNAATNTPTLTSSVGTPGYFYIVSVEGTTNLNGITDWKVGDWAVFVEAGGTDAWQKVDNTSVLDGAGTGGYIAQWAGSGTSVTLEDSVIYDTGTNIGIGTVTPQGKLDVNGSIISTSSRINAGADGILLSLRTSYAGNAAIIEAGQTASDGYLNVKDATGTIYSSLSGYSGTPSYFLSDVGIGTSTPVGRLHLYKAAAATRLAIDGDAGQNRLISYRTGALQRFGLYVNNTAESGSNSGSNFAIRAYSDAGTLLSTPFFINRATGNVGIGTTNPSNKLTVQGGTITAGTESSYALRILNGSKPITIGTDDNYAYIQSWSSAPLYINSQGNNVLFPNAATYVGIGLTSPLGPLSVAATASADAIFLTGRSADNASRIDFYNNAQSTRLFTLATGNGAVELYADANVPMTFSTAGNERMRILGTGYVGIGTNAPASKLEVAGPLGGTVGVGGSTLRLTNSDTGNYASITAGVTGLTNPGMQFSTDGTRRAVISSAGNFIIGSGNDAGYMLDVYGTGRFLNNLIVAKEDGIIGIDANNNPRIGFVKKSGLQPFLAFATDPFLLRVSSGSEVFASNTFTTVLTIATSGAARLNSYGSGTFTGTPTYNLAVDASGNIIETSGGVVDGSGTANYVTKWQDANTVTNSQIFDNGTNVGINNGAPSYLLDIYSTNTPVLRIQSQNSGGVGNPRLLMSRGGEETFQINVEPNVGVNLKAVVANAGYMDFYTGTDSVTMRLASSKNVLIGTTTDSGEKLRLVGSQLITSGNLKISGNATFGLVLNRDGTSNYNGIVYSTADSAKWFVGLRELGNDAYRIYNFTNSTEYVTIEENGVFNINNNAGSGVAGTNFRVYGYDSDSYFRLGNNTSNSLDIQLTRSDAATMFSVNGHSGYAFFATRVGINTTGPATRLDVVGNVVSTNGVIQATPTYSGGSYFTAFRAVPSDTGDQGNYTGLFMGSISSDNALITSGSVYNSAGQYLPGGTTSTGIGMGGGTFSVFGDTGLTAGTGFYPTTRMQVIGSTGNVLIGTTTDSGYKLYVNGNVYVNGTITEASARHLKENIKPLESTLDKINALEPVTYNLIGSDKNEIGLIAEDVAELFPQVVEYNAEGAPSGVNYTRLSVILIKALQEMSETLNKLQTK